MELFRIRIKENSKCYGDLELKIGSNVRNLDTKFFLDNPVIIEKLDLDLSKIRLKKDAVLGHLTSCLRDLLYRENWHLCVIALDLSDQYVGGLLFEKTETNYRVSYGFIQNSTGTDSRIPGNLITLDSADKFVQELNLGLFSKLELSKILFETHIGLYKNEFVQFDKYEIFYS